MIFIRAGGVTRDMYFPVSPKLLFWLCQFALGKIQKHIVGRNEQSVGVVCFPYNLLTICQSVANACFATMFASGSPFDSHFPSMISYFDTIFTPMDIWNPFINIPNDVDELQRVSADLFP